METVPLLKLKSHVDGKNADVEIFADRIEWAKAGGLSMTRLAAASLTMGASLAATGARKGGGTEMVPVKSMSSVTTQKDGLRFYKLVIVSSGNTIEFRVDKSEAEEAKLLLTQLMLGVHPSQGAAKLAAQPSPEMNVPAPAPAPAASSVGDQLRELAKLRDEGLLSEEEFQQQKSKILG